MYHVFFVLLFTVNIIKCIFSVIKNKYVNSHMYRIPMKEPEENMILVIIDPTITGIIQNIG